MQLSTLQSTHTGPQAPWLSDVRKAALARFEAAGLPTTRVEEWKYTSTKALGALDLVHAEAIPTVPAAVPAALRLEGNVCELVFVNGRFAEALSSTPWDGVDVLSGAVDEGVRSHVEGLTDDGAKDAFVALNTAFLQDGVFLRVRGDLTADDAVLHLLFLTTGEQVASHPRNVIVATPNSRVCVVETHASPDGEVLFDNAITQIQVQDGAAVTHHLWQRAGDATHLVNRIEVSIGRDACFAGHMASLGGRWVRCDHNLSLDATGAEVTLSGLYLVGDGQHVDNHTRIDHRMPHGTSLESYQGVIGGTGRAVFNGGIVVHKDAQQTDGKLSCHNLLLSDTARIDAKPELEIYADDVRCAHGTTVGQLDEEALFYLQARGIALTDAKRMLTAGFVAERVEDVVHEGLKARLYDLVNARLAEVQG